MAVYTTIPDSDVDPESPITTSLMLALRDNSLPYKIIEIGDWDMDATVGVSVTHGLTLANIRSVSALIRSDGDTIYSQLAGDVDESGATAEAQIADIGSSAVALTRQTGGQFDAAAYNATSFNRGWVTIFHVLP